MPSATERKIAELTRGMLRLRLFVIFSYGKGLDLKPWLADHLAYMIELERAGSLFASGPFGDGTTGDGMTIVRAANGVPVVVIEGCDPKPAAKSMRKYHSGS